MTSMSAVGTYGDFTCTFRFSDLSRFHGLGDFGRRCGGYVQGLCYIINALCMYLGYGQ